MIYRCNECGKHFNKSASRESTFENEYGLRSEFTSRTPCYTPICPYCKSEDWEEVTLEWNHDFNLGELADYFGEDEVIDFLNEGY